jgi:hypothetical protein
MKFTIPAKVLQAALLFVAKPNEPRTHLLGIHIYPDGRIYASNGHVCFKYNTFEPIAGISKPLIFSVTGSAFPKKAASAVVDIDPSLDTGALSFLDPFGNFIVTGNLKVLRAVERITPAKAPLEDGGYIDFEAAIFSKIERGPFLVCEFGVNPEYLELFGKAAKVLSARALKVRMYGGEQLDFVHAVPRCSEFYNAEFVVLPMSI